MATTVTIRECFKRLENQNPISGHSWIEHGKTTAFQVIGAVGKHSRHATLEKAEKEAKALQEFYNKFNI